MSNVPEKVYIMDNQMHHKAILQGIDWSTFCISWSKDNEYSLTFTCYVTNSYGYTLLTNENIIEFRGQQYVIKTYDPQFSSGYDAIQITATHIGFECQYIVHMMQKKGDVSMSIQDALHLLFDGNVKGFTWEVKGNFDKKTLTDFGNVDAKSGLSTIKETWDCEVTFDNKKVTVWSQDEYLHKINKTIRYRHDTDTIQLTGDSTSIVNKLYCVGATGDNDKPKYFAPFWVMDNDSINKWGDKTGALYSNDKVTNKNDMIKAAKATMQLNPTFSITVTYYGTDIPEFGSQVYLEVLPMNIKEWVEITGYKIYPFDPTQSGEIDLNSLKPNILSINNSLKNTVDKAIAEALANHTNTDIGSTNPSDVISVTNGTVSVSKNGNIVYVAIGLNSLQANTAICQLDTPYIPSTTRNGSFITGTNPNYIVNWQVDTQGQLTITGINDLSGQSVSSITQAVNGSFSYSI